MKSPLRILYAEDQAFYAEVLASALAEDGHVVRIAEDGQVALDLLAQDHKAFDLVITDHQMPRLDGLGFVAELRKTNFSGRIMVYSSCAGDLHAAYLALGVERVVAKSGDMQAMLAHVKELFPNQREF